MDEIVEDASVSGSDLTRTPCPVCNNAAQWNKDQHGSILVTCGSCGLVRADAHMVKRRLGAPEFQGIDEGRYRLDVLTAGVSLEVDYLRREGHQLKGELLVRCELPGARTYDGVLSIGDLNFSSTRARQSQAKYLAERAQAEDLDWTGLLEEFAQRVLAAERQGQPAVLLSDVPRPTPDETLEVDGLPLLARHPVVIFGDGGALKSCLALHIAGRLSERSSRVGLFDWELSAEDHRDRLERLFGEHMPEIHYARCTRPLVFEAERLRRIVRDKKLNHVILDSVAFACDGPPEAAEAAGRYFRALRQLGSVGSLHIAHVSKSLEGADRKPFGSVFWHNGARATWNVKRTDTIPDETSVTIALHNRKANLGARGSSVGFEFTFTPDRTHVRRVDLADIPDLAVGLSVAERIQYFLRSGPRSREEIKRHLEGVHPDSFRQALHRATSKGRVLRFPQSDGSERYALPERRRQ